MRKTDEQKLCGAFKLRLNRRPHRAMDHNCVSFDFLFGRAALLARHIIAALCVGGGHCEMYAQHGLLYSRSLALFYFCFVRSGWTSLSSSLGEHTREEGRTDSTSFYFDHSHGVETPVLFVNLVRHRPSYTDPIPLAADREWTQSGHNRKIRRIEEFRLVPTVATCWQMILPSENEKQIHPKFLFSSIQWAQQAAQ